jgi:transcriptional regulator with XRE-family HTH domain
LKRLQSDCKRFKIWIRRSKALKAKTLKELADRLDVSVATVSRALAGHQAIALKTRERVVQAARDQGLVVVLTGFWAEFEETLPWVRRMAEEYADDPYVWILPMNEPGCTVPEPGAAYKLALAV